MKIERLTEISQAEGRIEDFIERSIDGADESNIKATQLGAAWKTLSAGLKELREENFDLAGKLEKAKVLLGEYQLASN